MWIVRRFLFPIPTKRQIKDMWGVDMVFFIKNIIYFKKPKWKFIETEPRWKFVVHSANGNIARVDIIPRWRGSRRWFSRRLLSSVKRLCLFQRATYGLNGLYKIKFLPIWKCLVWYVIIYMISCSINRRKDEKESRFYICRRVPWNNSGEALSILVQRFWVKHLWAV